MSDMEPEDHEEPGEEVPVFHDGLAEVPAALSPFLGALGRLDEDRGREVSRTMFKMALTGDDQELVEALGRQVVNRVRWDVPQVEKEAEALALAQRWLTEGSWEERANRTLSIYVNAPLPDVGYALRRELMMASQGGPPPEAVVRSVEAVTARLAWFEEQERLRAPPAPDPWLDAGSI
jgi:hypothetical protein